MFAPKDPDGEYDDNCFSDFNFFRLATFVYENGRWKVDDFGWDVNLIDGVTIADNWYKEYVRKYSL